MNFRVRSTHIGLALDLRLALIQVVRGPRASSFLRRNSQTDNLCFTWNVGPPIRQRTAGETHSFGSVHFDVEGPVRPAHELRIGLRSHR